MIGKWSDNLTGSEVEFTKKCIKELQNVTEWHSFLNSVKIKEIINLRPSKERHEGDLNNIKAAMFEIRVAFLIYKSGLTADYEINANKASKASKKTVDFKIYGKKINTSTIFMELSSLRESQIQKNKTNVNNDMLECVLEESEEVSEYFKAQHVLREKAAKFPEKSDLNEFNIILLDVRTSILGCCDRSDFHNILHGSNDLPLPYTRYTKDNKLFPGIFCTTHQDYECDDMIHLRKSIHYFGFILEKEYSLDKLIQIQWFKNPNLTTSSDIELGKILNGKKHNDKSWTWLKTACLKRNVMILILVTILCYFIILLSAH